MDAAMRLHLHEPNAAHRRARTLAQGVSERAAEALVGANQAAALVLATAARPISSAVAARPLFDVRVIRAV